MKTMKLSLIAAMAATSFSVANAQDLAEAIKGVEVSGTVIYRYDDEETKDAFNRYKVATSLKSKVNDDVTFNSRFIAGDGTTDPVALNTSSSADGNANFQLTEANFAYTGISNTSVVLGKQGIPSPFTIKKSASGDEQVGTGLLAATTFSNVTLAGAYFNQTNFASSGNATSLYKDKNDGADLIYAGLMTSFGMVDFDAHYADSVDVFDAYTVGLNVKGNISDVALSAFARYSSLDLDNDDTDNNLWKVGVKAKAGIFGAFLAYGQTDEEGGTVGLDDGADVGFDEHWKVTLTGQADASAIYASVNAQVTDKVNLALKYSDLSKDAAGANDEDEIYVQASYKMSSNFKTYVRYGEYDVEGSDAITIGRLYVQYSF